jgi:hypothetical protein
MPFTYQTIRYSLLEFVVRGLERTLNMTNEIRVIRAIQMVLLNVTRRSLPDECSYRLIDILTKRIVMSRSSPNAFLQVKLYDLRARREVRKRVGKSNPEI